MPPRSTRRELRIAGFHIRVTPATLISVLLIAVLWNPTYALLGDVGSVVASLATGVLLLVSVLVHELFHALAARGLGQNVDHIELNLFGGHTQYRGQALHPWGSLLISLAGPISNLLLFWGLDAVSEALATSPGGSVGAAGTALVLRETAWLNLVLGVFNLVPALPLDGGNALRSLLRGLGVPSTPATLVTGVVGLVLAAAALLVPVVLFVVVRQVPLTVIVFIVLGLFLGQASWQAVRRASAEQKVAGLSVDHVARPLVVLPGQVMVAAADPGLQSGAIVISRGPNGAFLRVDPTAAAQVPRPARAGTALTAVLRPVGRVARVSSELSGVQLIHAAAASDADLFLVDEDAGAPASAAGRGAAEEARPAQYLRAILGEDLKGAAQRYVERR